MITVGYWKVDCCDRGLDGVGLCTGGSYTHSAVLPTGSGRWRSPARARRSALNRSWSPTTMLYPAAARVREGPRTASAG